MASWSIAEQTISSESILGASHPTIKSMVFRVDPTRSHYAILELVAQTDPSNPGRQILGYVLTFGRNGAFISSETIQGKAGGQP